MREGAIADRSRRAQALSASTTRFSSENPVLAAVELDTGDGDAAALESFPGSRTHLITRTARDPELKKAGNDKTCTPRWELTEFHRKHGVTRPNQAHWY